MSRLLFLATLLVVLLNGQTYDIPGSLWKEGDSFTVGSAVTQFELEIASDAVQAKIYIENLRTTSDNKRLAITVSTDGGSTYLSTNYSFNSFMRSAAATTAEANNISDSQFNLTQTGSFGVKSDGDAAFMVEFLDLGGSGEASAVWSGAFDGTAGFVVSRGGGAVPASSKITHVRILTDDTTGFTQGSARVLNRRAQ